MIDEYSCDENDPNTTHFYSCGLCVKGGAGLGSIVHWCTDVFGLIGGKDQILYNGDGRKKWSH
jgi:hypothetical protein